MVSSSSPEPSTDGRRLRAEASRARIVAAMMELVREGYATPPAEAVAERAGVGMRTVFRLFNDMDSLYREMQTIMLAQLAPIASEPVLGESWRERLRNLIHRRTRLFEELMPLKVAADAQRARSSYLLREHDHFLRLQREMATSLLPEEVKQDTDLVEMLDLLMSFDAWRRLRLDQKLAFEDAERIMALLVRRVVGD